MATKDDSALKLLELEKDAERAITGFFKEEAKASLLSTLKLAVDKAISGGSDKANVCVISKRAGDGLTYVLPTRDTGRQSGRQAGS